MSVINRMLSDLERRGAPTELRSDPAMVADRPRARGRWRALLARGFPIVLAVVLVAIAAALWLERGPRLLAGLAAGGAPAVTAPATAVPELVGLAFEGEARRPRLVLQLDGALGRAPRYSRSGGHATLSLDARASELSLPAPPSAQEVFRGITLEPAGDGRTRLRLDVAPEAGLELRADGNRVVLTGRPPEPAAAEAAREPATGVVAAAASAGAGAGGRSASDGREPAARDPEPADAGDAAGVRPAEPTEGGDESAARSAKATGAGATQVAPDRTGAEASAGRGAGEHPERTDSGAGTGRQAPTQGGVDAATSQTVRKTQSLSPEMRARRRYRDGRRALADGELSAARRLLGTALELDPGLHAARDLLVGLARRAGETDTARALLLDGVERAPERVKFALPLARLLVDVGELDRAAGVLARARTTGAGNAGYHALTAAVAQRRGQHRQAAREYTRALELDAGNGLWWLGLGISLAASGHPDEARAALNEARASGDLSEGLDRWAQGRIDELDGGREG